MQRIFFTMLLGLLASVVLSAFAANAYMKHSAATNGVYCDSPLGKDMLKCKKDQHARPDINASKAKNSISPNATTEK